MNRRNFLGSLIGMVASASFYARLETQPWQRVLLPYRMLYRANGVYIQGTGIQSMLPIANRGFRFVAEDLVASTAMIVDRAVLLDEQGVVIQDRPLTTKAYLCNGQILHSEMELVCDYKVDSVEEMIDIARRITP